MILLFPHAATQNHGCEAIIHSTAGILAKQGIDNDDLYLLHKNLEHDDVSSVEELYHILDFKIPSIKRWSIKWAKYQIKSRASGCKYVTILDEFESFMKGNDKPDVMMFIGGDNYCYGKPYGLYAIDKWAKSKHIPLVLWGCSVEETKDQEMIDDLEQFDLIIARESMTYEYLCKITDKKVILYPDPAFTLQPEAVPTDIFEVKPDTVGINISPMIMDYECANNMAFQNYVNLVEYILSSTQLNIMLIPHVTVATTNDLIPLRKLYEMYKNTGRVDIVSDMKCTNLKYLISRCRYFIGARTHATIAAYSSNVPTLVVGYSVKAKGIAKDLFGTYDDYVLPVQSLNSENQLTEAFRWLENHEDTIRGHLEKIMPEYIERAYLAGAEIRKLYKDE